MADGNASTFPKIAESNWWKLRELFKRKVPSQVTPNYLASALGMGESSAKSNLIGPFRKIGIIDDDGKPTDLAYDWRDNSKYYEVCAVLIEKYYPQEIRDLFHSPDADLQQVTSWFMNYCRCGEPAGKMLARFYILLLKADLNEANIVTSKTESKPSRTRPKEPKVAKTAEKGRQIQTVQDEDEDEHGAEKPGKGLKKAPELHINIQLHISPESSAEQIDRIFESMAKHLKEFN